MKVFSKVFKVIVISVTIFALVVSAALMAPSLFGIKPCIAQSGSMEETVPAGSLIYINTNYDNIDVDDIITYNIFNESKNKEVTVTHRVVAVSHHDRYITKGDENKSEDINIVFKDQIIGKYVFNIPYVGFIIDRIGHKGFILIAVWIILLNSLSIFLSFLFERKEKADNPKKTKTQADTIEPAKT